MRWALLAIATLGCAGGQTGEITRPSDCTEPTEVALDEADRSRIAPLGEPWSGTLTWHEDGSETELTLALTLLSGPATRLEGEGCERGRLIAPIELRAATADGHLDDVLTGTLELVDGIDVAAVRATHPLDSLDGTLEPSWTGASSDGELVAVLDRDALDSHGQLFVDPGGEEDELPIGEW